MYSAQYKLRSIVTTLIMGVVASFFNPSVTFATNVSVCNPGENCTVGEYLYDDEYQPDTGATCNLNSKNPDGTAYLTNQSLSSTADGWYGHTFTTPTTTGYYRSEICCTAGSDYLCIDKSFEVKEEVAGGSSLTTNDIASAVWGYSGRTLTGFNNIVSDVWGFASRTLTSGANITTSVSSTEVTNINTVVNETRLLLEQLINKPIIENSLEEVEEIDLGQRISDSKIATNELYVNLLLVNTALTKTNKNWKNLTDRQILDNLTEAKNLLGDEPDSSTHNTIFGKTNLLRSAWGFKEADDLYEEAKAVKQAINYTITGLSSYGKSSTLQKEVVSAINYTNSSEKVLASLNKKISETESLSNLIDNNLIEVNKVLGLWTTSSFLELKNKTDSLTKNIIAINKVPKGQQVIESIYSDITGEKKVKNKLLGLRALLFANKKLLIDGQKTAFAANWLEEGSIVVKTLITNPSNLISQEVPLKYYLPKEIKEEHIIDVDTGAEVKYDPEKDQFYINGTFTLKPGETRTIKVRLEDVWQISESEIDSLLKQTEELTGVLEKTAYFAQGITLKSEIDINLTKAKDFLDDGITPEAKIKAYREAELQIISAQEKISKLTDLVTLAQSSGSILGFVGGSQAIGVWGIVIAITTGFIFMTIYMRKLLNPKKAVTVNASHKGKDKPNHFDKIAVFLVVATISGLLSSITVKKFVVPQQLSAKQTTQVLGSTTVDYNQLKAVELVSIDGVVKVYQDEGTETIAEILDSGKLAVEVERGEKRVKVVFDQKEIWVGLENVLVRSN